MALNNTPLDLLNVLVIGPFRGDRAPALPYEKPATVDRDTLDTFFSDCRPFIGDVCADADGETYGWEGADMADFHPDQLIDRLPPLSQLERQVKKAKQDPALARRLLGLDEDSSTTTDVAPTGGLLDRVVDATPDANTTAAGYWDALIQRVGREFASRPRTEAQDEAVAQLQQLQFALLRDILLHPRFANLESLWRSTELLVRNVETTPQLKIHLLDCQLPTADNSVAWFSALGSAMSSERPDIVIWGPAIESRAELDALWGAMKPLAQTQRFWLAAGAQQGVFCSEHLQGDLDHDPLPANLPSFPPRDFCLAWPCMAARLPYGPKTSSTRWPQFHESPSGHPTVWANPAFAIVAGICHNWSVAQEQWRSTHSLTCRDVPAPIVYEDGEAQPYPATGIQVTERMMERLLEHGLCAVMNVRNEDSVRMQGLRLGY